MSLKAVLFDLDDTLLWDDRSVREAFIATCKKASQTYDISPEQLEASVRKEARSLYEQYEVFPFTKQIGINPFEALWANFTEGEMQEFKVLKQLVPNYRREAWTLGLKSLGINDALLGQALAERFPSERRARPYVYEDTFTVLNALKPKYKLLLLTNGAPDLQKEKIAGVPQLSSYFDHIIISGNYGIGKPDPSIFKHAMDLLSIQPDDGIMVGDKLTTDILGSNHIGMKNVWINRHLTKRTDEIVPTFEITELSELLAIIKSLA